MIDINALNSKVPQDDNTYIGQDGLLKCKHCDGNRETIINVFGNDRKVRCICECMRKQRDAEAEKKKAAELEIERKRCFAESNMWKWTFANDDGSNIRLTKAMQNYVKNFRQFKASGKGLLLYGTVGTGKSYMAAAVANELIDQGYKVYMTNFARLVKLLQGTFEKQKLIDDLNRYSLLIIDDLGAERKSEFMQEQVFNIIDARYRAGLPAIITTNLDIEEIKKPADIGSGRIYDRILERCHPIEVTGISRRRQKVKNEYVETNRILGL